MFTRRKKHKEGRQNNEYVIFKRKSLFIPVILPECATHACVTYEDAKPVSAGFCYVNKMGRLDVDIRLGSDSLDLLPAPIDDILLNALHLSAGMYAFVDMGEMEHDYDKGRLEKD